VISVSLGPDCITGRFSSHINKRFPFSVLSVESVGASVSEQRGMPFPQSEKARENLSKMDWNITSTDQILDANDRNITTMDRSFSWALFYLSTFYDNLEFKYRLYCALLIIQAGYYPFLAVVGIPGECFYLNVNSMNLILLSG